MEQDSNAVSYLNRQIEETNKRIHNERKEVLALSNKIAEITAERWVVIRSNRSKREILGVSSVEDSRWQGLRFRLIDGEPYVCIRYYEINHEISVHLPVGGVTTFRLQNIAGLVEGVPEEIIRIYAFDDRVIAQTHQ